MQGQGVRTPFQERRHNNVGPEHRHGFLGDAVVDVEFDGHRVAVFAQHHEQALGQAIEGMG